MSGVAKIQAPPLAQNIQDTKATDKLTTGSSKKVEDAKKVGQDFEAILVRQMLSQAHIGGKGGYADMANEALATAVTKGGGLGFGKVISQHLEPLHTELTDTNGVAIPAAQKPLHPTAANAAVSAFKRIAGPETAAQRMPLPPAQLKPLAPVPGAPGTVYPSGKWGVPRK